MTKRLVLKLWGPGGERGEFELSERREVVRTLLQWSKDIGCGPNDVDYQVNDGLRIMGEANPYAGEVD